MTQSLFLGNQASISWLWLICSSSPILLSVNNSYFWLTWHFLLLHHFASSFISATPKNITAQTARSVLVSKKKKTKKKEVCNQETSSWHTWAKERQMEFVCYGGGEKKDGTLLRLSLSSPSLSSLLSLFCTLIELLFTATYVFMGVCYYSFVGYGVATCGWRIWIQVEQRKERRKEAGGDEWCYQIVMLVSARVYRKENEKKRIADQAVKLVLLRQQKKKRRKDAGKRKNAFKKVVLEGGSRDEKRRDRGWEFIGGRSKNRSKDWRIEAWDGKKRLAIEIEATSVELVKLVHCWPNELVGLAKKGGIKNKGD